MNMSEMIDLAYEQADAEIDTRDSYSWVCAYSKHLNRLIIENAEHCVVMELEGLASDSAMNQVYRTMSRLK